VDSKYNFVFFLVLIRTEKLTVSKTTLTKMFYVIFIINLPNRFILCTLLVLMNLYIKINKKSFCYSNTRVYFDAFLEI